MNFNMDYYLASLVFVIEGSLKTACGTSPAGCCEFFVRFLFTGLAAISYMLLILPGHPVKPVKLFSTFGAFFHNMNLYFSLSFAPHFLQKSASGPWSSLLHSGQTIWASLCILRLVSSAVTMPVGTAMIP